MDAHVKNVDRDQERPQNMFASFLMDNVSRNTVSDNILYSTILNKLMPQVKDSSHTHRDFLFIYLEYCSRFLFIGFSAQEAILIWLILTFCLCIYF